MTLSLSTVRAPRSASVERATLRTYYSVWQQRRALARLDIERLTDMGISPSQARKEIARPFWDLP